MPWMFTLPPKSTTWTKACDGAIEPASIWKPGATCGMSRIEPLVMVPRQPSALWMLVCTSPQNAPKPTMSSRSWITAMPGCGCGGDVVEIVEPLVHVAGLAERHAVLRPHGDGLGEAHHRRQVGERAVQMPHRVAEAAPLRRDDLKQIADGRRVDRAQEFELRGGDGGHGVPPIVQFRVPGAAQHRLVMRCRPGTPVSREQAGSRVCGAPLRAAPRAGNADGPEFAITENPSAPPA